MFIKNSSYKHLDFLILDEVCLLIGFFIVYLSRNFTFQSFADSAPYKLLLLIMLMIGVVLTFFMQPHKNILRRSYVGELKSALTFFLSSYLLLVFVLYVLKTSSYYSRVVIGLTYVYALILAYVFRQLLKVYINKKGRSSALNSNVKMLVITNSKSLDNTIEKINSYNYDMYEIDGLCVIDKDLKGEKVDKYTVVANKNDVMDYVCANWVDEVYFAMDYVKIPEDMIKGLAVAGVTTNIRLRKITDLEGREQSVQKLFNTTVVRSSIRQRTNRQIFFKRVLDILGGIVGSLLTLLIALFIWPVMHKKSPGPLFYKQERIGQNGRRFYMYKFRSMVLNADELKKDLMAQNRIKDGMMFKVKDDPRIIPGIGEFIRKTSLECNVIIRQTLKNLDFMQVLPVLSNFFSHQVSRFWPLIRNLQPHKIYGFCRFLL